MTPILIINKEPPTIIFLNELSNFEIPIIGVDGFPSKYVKTRLIKNVLLGFIYFINYINEMCFFIYKFQHITILINIDILFARKNEPVPKLMYIIK